MGRLALTIGVFLGGVVTAGLALYAAVLLAPPFIDANEEVATLAVAADEPLHTFPDGAIVYVHSSAIDAMLIKSLQQKFPSLHLLPWSARPKDQGCKPGQVVPPVCQRNDFVIAELLSFPTWRTAIARVGVFNAGSQLVLIKCFGKWRIIARTGYII